MRRYVLASFYDLRYWSTCRELEIMAKQLAEMGQAFEEVTKSMSLLSSALLQPPFLGYTVDKP